MRRRRGDRNDGMLGADLAASLALEARMRVGARGLAVRGAAALAARTTVHRAHVRQCAWRDPTRDDRECEQRREEGPTQDASVSDGWGVRRAPRRNARPQGL